MIQTFSSRLTAAALVAVMPVAVAAQDDDAGGMRLTFDLSQQLSATTNDDLTNTSTDPRVTATTSLSAGFLSETRSERLSFNLSTGLRITEDDTGVTDPAVALAYRRTGPAARLDLYANWTQSSFDTLRSLTAFRDADGTLVLPDDLDDLIGTGTRTIRNAGAGLRWGENAPLGASLGVDVSDLRYEGDGTGSLEDSRSASVTAGLHLNLTPVSTADITLRYRRTDDGDLSDSTRLTATYTLDRPLGAITATLTADRDADDDTQLGVSFGRRYALPETTLDARIGLTQDSNGDPALTGRLAWQRNLPNGQLRLNFAQAVATGSDGDTDTTALSASYNYTLTPRSSLQLGFDYVRAADTGSTITTRSLSASYGYQLTPEWLINVGASTSLRDPNNAASTDAQTVFMTLNRSLSVRP